MAMTLSDSVERRIKKLEKAEKLIAQVGDQQVQAGNEDGGEARRRGMQTNVETGSAKELKTERQKLLETNGMETFGVQV